MLTAEQGLYSCSFYFNLKCLDLLVRLVHCMDLTCKSELQMERGSVQKATNAYLCSLLMRGFHFLLQTTLLPNNQHDNKLVN